MKILNLFKRQKIDHLVCCDRNLALCGEDVTDADEIPDGGDTKNESCILCVNLAKDFGYECPQCGCHPYELCGKEVSF